MGQRNARLTVHGRRFLVGRVRVEGTPIISYFREPSVMPAMT